MIHVENLEFTYQQSGKKAIKDISFHVEQGEIFGFLGPSGAGKTTMQKLMIGLLEGYNGKMEILGKERSVFGLEFYEEIGVAFDFPNLYLKLTAYENLKLISQYYKKKCTNIDQLLDQFGLLEDRNTRVENYSKGMKMRLNFLRSLLHDPQLYFFDEPTSGLDPVNAAIVKNQILSLKAKGKTVFLTTHNMTVATQLCDRVAFMVEGSIPVIETPSKLMREYGKKEVCLTYAHDNEEEIITFPFEKMGRDEAFLEAISRPDLVAIHSKEATLEEVFIACTGKSLK